MRSLTLRIGKFLGIDVYVHWSFWLIVVWVFLAHLGADRSLASGLQSVLFILALFVCVVLHEFGHALAARQFGISTRDITLYPIGGISSLERMPENPRQELIVAIAGPAVNLVIALILWIVLIASGQSFEPATVVATNDVSQIPFLWSLFFANIMLPIFNLLPAFPLDGGRALRSILSFFISRSKATAVAAQMGQLLAILFVVFGLFYNFWLIFIGFFVFIGAGAEATLERTKTAVAGLRVRDALMKKFTTFSPTVTLGKVSDALLNSQESVFLISEGGVPVGILGINEIVKGLSEKGANALVSEYMTSEFPVVSPDMKLGNFLEEVLGSGPTVAVVKDGESILGLIDATNFQERVMISEALDSGKAAEIVP